ncbi:diacylglycerol O-acyltransferase 1 [Vanrija albida]|uniref:Diacylglycerol O-acyltransferase n=1 Tax=Vanrija albida TaxID=181172 RepID=A0ABR3PYY1_9TREE
MASSMTSSPPSSTSSLSSAADHQDNDHHMNGYSPIDGPSHVVTQLAPCPGKESGGLRLRLSSAVADATIDATPGKPQDNARNKDAVATNGSVGATTKTKQQQQHKSKPKSSRLKSPILDALKLPPLSEISIPRPVQIKFAPLHIPPHRRLQTAAVATFALLLPITLILYLFALSFPCTWPVLVPYTIWALYIDKAPIRGGRPKEWARRLSVWKFFAQYYPCSIVKEADLPADKRYVFGYHPHGIIGMGAIATFATEATGFSDNYPGIRPNLLTLESNFNIPVYRELLMFQGISSVSRRSCHNILSKGAGSAIAIVVGGAAESLSAHPGTHDLTLKRRFGFIKVAIREGANLVPVFSFGENDIYEQLANEKGSTVFKLQKQFQRVFGFTLPLFHGRGIFNYNYGLMPYRHPIVSVIGRPVDVEQCDDPSPEMVQKVHQQYIDELVRIWDKYKDIYAKHRTRELTLVE